MTIKKLLLVLLSPIYFSAAYATEEASNALAQLYKRATELNSQISALDPIINAEGKTYQNLLPENYKRQLFFSDADLINLKEHWKSLGVTQAKEQQLLLGIQARQIGGKIEELRQQNNSTEDEKQAVNNLREILALLAQKK